LTTHTHAFERTTCACKDCVDCCKRQPGPLAPGQFEAIAAHLGQTHEQAKEFFVASPGALLKNSQTGRVFRIGTITPRMRPGRCVFLTANDRCGIHAVAPFGCAQFDTHQSAFEALPRSMWLARATADPDYQALRRTLPIATTYNPTSY
jgi:Fe-S-cluster containining protein